MNTVKVHPQKFGTCNFVHHDYKIEFYNFSLEEHHVSWDSVKFRLYYREKLTWLLKWKNEKNIHSGKHHI